MALPSEHSDRETLLVLWVKAQILAAGLAIVKGFKPELVANIIATLCAIACWPKIIIKTVIKIA